MNNTYQDYTSNNYSTTQIIAYCLLIYLLSRILVGFEYYLTMDILDNHGYYVDVLWKWDSGLYQEIAETGYRTSFDGQSTNWPFFPMWPLVLKATTLNGILQTRIVGLIVNQFIFFCSMVVIFKLFLQYQFSLDDSKLGVFLLAISPANIYFCSGLSENTFLLLSLLSFYFLQTKRTYGYLIAAAMLSATRIVGAFFVIPLIYYHYRHRKSMRQFILQATAESLVCLTGLALFMLYMQIHTGHPLGFLEVQSVNWPRHGLHLNSHIFSEMWSVATTTSSKFDRSIFWVGIFFTFLLLLTGFVKEGLFNFCCVIPALISGNLWCSWRFDTTLFTYYLALMIILRLNGLLRYLAVAIMCILAMISWHYWLMNTWVFI